VRLGGCLRCASPLAALKILEVINILSCTYALYFDEMVALIPPKHYFPVNEEEAEKEWKKYADRIINT